MICARCRAPREALILDGNPKPFVAFLRGCRLSYWHLGDLVGRFELAGLRSRYTIISERLTMGQVRIHVFADGDPGDGFEKITPDLEDVYFSTIRDGRQAEAA